MISRQIVLAVALGVIGLGGCKGSKPPATVADAAADKPKPTPPSRTPGLWRVAMTMEGVPGVSTVSLCLDAETDKKLSWTGDPQTDACDTTLEQAPDGAWRFSTSCKQGAVSVERSGAARGDFKNAYSLEGDIAISGSPDPRLNGSKTFTASATHAGACPADLRPGYMDIPGQGKVDALNLGKAN